MRNLIIVPTELERNGVLPADPDDAYEVVVCGAGLVSSAANVARLIAAHKPHGLLLLGICGAYSNSGLKPGDLVRVDASVLADFGAEDRSGELIPASLIGLGPVRWEATDPHHFLEGEEGVLRDRLCAIKGVVSASVQAACGTTTTALHRVALTGAAVEEMEGAAVLAVAAAMGVSCWHLRAVSNIAGDRDRDSWRIDLALETLYRWLHPDE